MQTELQTSYTGMEPYKRVKYMHYNKNIYTKCIVKNLTNLSIRKFYADDTTVQSV